MHPNLAFAWPNEAEMYAFIAETAVAHIFAATPAGPMVAHAPVIVTGEGRLQFHIAKANRMTTHLDGATVLLSMMATNAYQSADWYQAKDHVPTWLYRAVEIDGMTRLLEYDELVMQVDTLSATMEQRLLPKRPWTRAKMPQGKFEAMLPAILGFEVAVTALRGTRKMNQHRGKADVAAMIAGQRAAGREDIVVEIEAAVAAR